MQLAIVQIEPKAIMSEMQSTEVTSGIQLGTKVRDSISGFQGVAAARTTYLHASTQVLVKPECIDKDGRFLDPIWFDETQLQEVVP